MIPTRSILLHALAAATSAAPVERRLLVVPRMSAGREVLRALTASGTGWIGWEIVTLRRLAHELVADRLAGDALELADEYDEAALLDEAMNEVLAGGTGSLAELADAAGLRRAVTTSVHALRMAGVDAALLADVRLRDDAKRDQVARILAAYETLLDESARVDAAALMRMAADAVRSNGLQCAAWLMPGLDCRGVAGGFVGALLEHGAAVLPADAVAGLPAPVGVLAPGESITQSRLSLLHAPDTTAECDVACANVDVFTASSVAAEVREVLRRVTAEGLRWDEVEIIATDAGEYGVVLDGLARSLGVPVTHAAGLPVSRTRPGRVVMHVLRWLEQGLPAEGLRRLLEGGDVRVGEGLTGGALARMLRSMRVPAGRHGYAAAVAQRRRELAVDADAQDRDAERVEREVAALEGLHAFVTSVLAPLPEHGAAPADVAGVVLVLLEQLRVRSAADALVREQLLTIMQRVRDTAQRRTRLDAAVAVVLGHVDRTAAAGAAPTASAGGALHFSDLVTGGWTGRRATYVVGLDSGRFPGAGGVDALLVDDDRERVNAALGTPALAMAAERVAERRHALAALLARLRGSVTVSWPAWQALEGRALTPASEALQIHRLRTGDPTADYGSLAEAVGDPRSVVPRHGAVLDGEDVWLAALAEGGALRRGVVTVCDAFPGLGAGARAWRDRIGVQRGEPLPIHGAITPRPELDPRRSAAVTVSATSLQTLGTCPHRYLLRHVLRLTAPEQPAVHDGWLTPLQRGRLLHAVYERVLRVLREEAVPADGSAWEDRARVVLDEEVARMREAVPARGAGVLAVEVAALRADVNGFVAMVREDGGRWLALEHRFGTAAEPLPLRLPDGTMLHVEGVLDRVDELDDGRLAVLDYKTGSRARFDADGGVWDGGRRLQHLLYMLVAEQVWEREVERVEYLFPGARSQNHRAPFARAALQDGPELLTDLLDFVRSGWFVPTNDPADCAVCDFQSACRVRPLPWDKVESPMAAFMREAGGPAADALRKVRR